MRIQPVIYRAHSTVPSRWLTSCEPAPVVISLGSSAALIPSSSSLSLSSSHCELLRVILLQGELSPERAHLAHTLCDSLTLCLSLLSLPLVLYFVGLTRAKSVRAQRTMLSTNCYSDACVRSAKTKPRLCFHFSLNNNNGNNSNSRNWKTKKLPSSEKRQIIITNTSTTRLCVSETRKSNRRNGKKQNVENKN